MANEEHLAILRQGVEVWNGWRSINPFIEPDLTEADLSGTNFTRANFEKAKLTKANLSNSQFESAVFTDADLTEANLSLAIFIDAFFGRAILIRTNCTDATFRYAKMQHAKFIEAVLVKTLLMRADLTKADLTGANLTSANLRRSTLIQTCFKGATLVDCKIYGVSAWDLNLEGALQSNLTITDDTTDMPAITVNDIEVAQFVCLLLNNQKIRNVINTITSKTVLILGRFTQERKHVLDAIRQALHHYDYVSIIFDFEPSNNRNLTETVLTLASMARFVIADLTDPSSIPQELTTIIPQLSSVPIQPILLAERKREYAMFKDWQSRPTVLNTFFYENEQHLIDNLESCVIQPAINWKSRQKTLEIVLKEQEELQREKEELQRKIQMLEKQARGEN